MRRARLHIQLARSQSGNGSRPHVADHLAALLACRVADARVAALIAHCRSLPAPPLPPGVEQRLMAICSGWRANDETGEPTP